MADLVADLVAELILLSIIVETLLGGSYAGFHFALFFVRPAKC